MSALPATGGDAPNVDGSTAPRAGLRGRLARAFTSPRSWVIAAVVVRVGLGVWGIAHFAYMGQDFQIHVRILETVPTGFAWDGTNPPLLYAVAWFVREYLTRRFFLEVTSLVFLAINVASVPLVVKMLGRLGLSPRGSALGVILLLFMPFWVVHTAVFAADVFTVPLFFAIAELLCRLYEEPRGGPREIAILAGLQLALALAVLAKYTFLYLLVLAALLVAWRYRREPLRLVPAALIVCLLPGLIGIYEVREMVRVNAYVLYGAYTHPGSDYPQPDPMRLQDMFLLKRADLKLLRAPQFYADELNEPYRYSYAGLLHVTAYTDSFGFFQPNPREVPVWSPRGRLAVEANLLAHPGALGKARSPLARWASPVAVVLSLPLSLLALWGTLRATWQAFRAVLARRGGQEGIRALILAMALAYYVPVLRLLPRVVHAYRFGYWLPRLVMPSLLVFLALGIVELGRIARPFPWTLRLAPAATVLLAAVYVLAV